MSATPAGTPLPAPPPSRDLGWVRRRLRRLLEHFWVVPAAWCVVALAAGALLPSLDVAASWIPVLFPGDSDGARSLLSTIAGAMISVTGLVFSITVVVLQLASSQFSPRVLRTFLSRRITQNTLGVFAATFLYALTVLRSVENVSAPADPDTSPGVPQLAVTVAYLLVLAAVAMFLAFIYDVTRSIDVATIMRQIAAETHQLIDRSLAHRDLLPNDLDRLPEQMPELAGQAVVVAPRSGYLDEVDGPGLCRAAAGLGVRVEVLHRLGTFLPQGAPLALVSGVAGRDEHWDAVVAEHVSLHSDRSTAQDLSWGIRRLVDIAERALSPGINDPTTAVQVVDQLHDLLRRAASLSDVVPVHRDGDGVPRAVLTEHTFADLLDLAVDEIAHWGADSRQVPPRLCAMLDDLGAVASAGHLPAIRAATARVLARSVS